MSEEKLLRKLSKNDAIEEQAKAIQEDYHYLDSEDMTLEQWMWEFIRRNPGYIALYKEIKEDFNKTDLLHNVTDFQDLLDNIHDSIITKKLLMTETNFDVTSYLLEGKKDDSDNFISIENLDLFIGVPNPRKKSSDFSEHTPIIKGATSVTSYVFHPETVVTGPYHGSQFEKYCYELVMKRLPPNTPSDTLYIGISLNGNRDDIKRQVNKIINEKIKPANGRIRDDKWKYYLMAHDLKTQGMSYDKIARVLSVVYVDEEEATEEERNKRDKSSLFDVKNIENYYKNSLSLINGDYKKYLYLEK